jgi:hypothetical protein
MKFMARNAGLLLGCLIVLGLAGCSDREREIDPVVQELLKMVPVDTPYVGVAARVQKMPVALVDKLLQSRDMPLEQRRRTLEQSFRTWEDMGLIDESAAAKFHSLLLALIEEVGGKNSVKQWHSLGLEPNPRSLFYGLGLYPVIWQEVADEDKVAALMSRVEARSGVSAEKMDWKGQAYRRVPVDRFSLIIALRQGYLVAALLPRDQEQKLLPRVFGEQRPGKSLADGAFVDFALQRKFPGYMEGYLDLERLLAVLQDADEISAGWLPDNCRGFFKDILHSAPVVSLGMRELNEKRWVFSMTLEMAPGPASRLQAIPAPVPGMGRDDEAMLSFGVGLNFPRLRDAINGLLRHFIRAGRGCELVDEEVLTRGIQGISMGMNPMLAEVRGFNLELDELVLNPQSRKPEKIEGSLVLAAGDPAGMLGMLSMADPRLATLEIPADGKPVQLALDDLLPLPSPVFTAIRGEILAVAMGQKARSRVEQALSLSPTQPYPMLSFSFDPASVLQLMELQSRATLATLEASLKELEASPVADDAEEEASRQETLRTFKQSIQQLKQEQKSVQLAFGQIANAYRKGGMQVYGTQQGLELRFVYEFTE